MRLGSEKWDFWKRRGRKKTMETAKYQEPFRVSPSSLSLKVIFISMVCHLLLWSCHHYQGKDIAKYREPFRVSPTLQWHLSPPSGTFFYQTFKWMRPFLLPFLGIELNVALGNDIPNIARIIIHIPHALKYIHTHVFDFPNICRFQRVTSTLERRTFKTELLPLTLPEQVRSHFLT